MNLNWEKHGIDISKVVGGKGFCPKCHHTRKHKRDRSLSIDVQSGLFNCHNCEFRGSAIEYAPKKEFIKPVERLEKLSKKTLNWFENERGISNDTLLRFKISEAKEWMPQHQQETTCICFNYFRMDQLINIKFRGPQKSFKMAQGAELIFYNLDAIAQEKWAVIVEGEMDCLTMHECGVYNSISVPNGANKGSMKLEYLDNCWQAFEGMEKIVIATDGDEPGRMLRDELARRLGKQKCYLIDYPEGLKDANEVMLKLGKDAVKQMISDAQQWPIEGIKKASDMYVTTTDWFEKGYPQGAKAGVVGFDDLLTFSPGQLTTVTGIPGHGKDEFMNLVMAKLAKNEGWVWGICGFEESPEETETKLIEKLMGKSFGVRANPLDRLTKEEYESGVDLIEQYFLFINADEIDTDIETILSKAEELVKRYGIKGFTINPWNWIDHTRTGFMSETEYISMTLSKIIRFAKKFRVHVILIAHTTKMLKDKTGKFEVPNLYNISGSANFFNKTHNGISVYRDYSNGVVDVYVQKVKQSWLGKIGFASYHFNTKTRQYSFVTNSDMEQKASKKAKETPVVGLPEGTWTPIAKEQELF